jgi:hypothetical protein
MIIFDKFGDGQSERNRSVPVFPNNPTRTVTRVSPLRLLPLLALTKDGTKDGTNGRHASGMSERLSRSALVAPPAVSMHGPIRVSLREPRLAGHGPRTPISNRELDLLERHLSHCKQRKATVSNRELSTISSAPKIVNFVPFWISESPSCAPISDANFRQLTAFLPGSGRKVEVTEKKRLNPVYPALEMHITAARFRAEFRTESQAQREKESGSPDAAEQGKIPLHTRNEKELS